MAWTVVVTRFCVTTERLVMSARQATQLYQSNVLYQSSQCTVSKSECWYIMKSSSRRYVTSSCRAPSVDDSLN